MASKGFIQRWFATAHDGPVNLVQRSRADMDEIDMTPMIDCVFLLLIFFLVGSTSDLQSALDLPPARHGVGADPRSSVVVTVAEREGSGPPLVYLADGKAGAPLPDDPAVQAEAISRAVEQGVHEGKLNVLIKAERNIKHRDVARVAAAATRSEISKLFLAVFEID